ncbi:MAG TPA: hypothetical protein VGC08_03060 [Pedobacter sp.]
MKRLFKNVNTFGLLGMLVMGLLVFTQSAFKSDVKHVGGSYYFNGTSAGQIKAASAWDATLDTDQYLCVDMSNLPCQIEVPESETLESYLENHTAAEITASAISRRTDAP